MITDPVSGPFPIFTEITVSCKPEYTHGGDEKITCSLLPGGVFSYNLEPRCCSAGIVCGECTNCTFEQILMIGEENRVYFDDLNSEHVISVIMCQNKRVSCPISGVIYF